ncbi:Non-specific serine/threonine protein kinase [Bertholletia excelsa]
MAFAAFVSHHLFFSFPPTLFQLPLSPLLLTAPSEIPPLPSIFVSCNCSFMGYFSCNAESAVATCDPLNWDIIKKNKNRNKPIRIREFSYSDLDFATGGFSPSSFLGKGSHGSVFKAVLDGGKLVAAVKRTTAAFNLPENNCNNYANIPSENEIEVLSRVRSPTLVNLLGYAADSLGRKLIVVEFMPNGSVHESLHVSARPPSWNRRVLFAIQVAKAVQELHSSNPPVIHRDIKSSNVLIDSHGNARLGDFGLALRGHVEDVRAMCTPPAGTLGYLDPGYLAPEDLSTKSDVFSFGILLLEIMSGREAIDVNYSPPSVVDWALPLISAGDYAEICDPRIGPPEDAAALRQLVVLAARCVRSKAERRPSMSEVVDCLKEVRKRISPPIWNSLRGCARNPRQSIKYQALDAQTNKVSSSRVGSRRNSKVSSVPSAKLGNGDRVGRSKSVGSAREIKFEPLDSSYCGGQAWPVRTKAGLAVRMPTVRLSKSRSMGVLRGPTPVPMGKSDGEKLEESNWLINTEKKIDGIESSVSR